MCIEAEQSKIDKMRIRLRRYAEDAECYARQCTGEGDRYKRKGDLCQAEQCYREARFWICEARELRSLI